MNHFCRLCNRNIGTFSHISKFHKITLKEYYDKYVKKKKEGKCVICGKDTKFRAMLASTNAYNKTCSITCKKKLGTYNFKNTLKYWLNRGYSEEEAIIKSKKVQRKRGKLATKKKNKLRKEGKYFESSEIGYWLNKGYSEEEAKQKLHERQSTFTLEKCIKKLGEVEGRKRWQERQDKWQNTMKNKPESEKAEIEKRRLKRNGYTVSKAEKEIIETIKKLYENIEDQKVMFTLKNGKRGNKKFVYDFCLEDKKKIIEYNGDYWHCNPKIYVPTYYNSVTKMTAKQKWKKDKKKIDFAKQQGYDVLVIWEKEYNDNKKETINRVVNFLKGNTNEI